MQIFKSSTATVIELRFFMKKQKMKKVFRTSCDIFIQFVLHAVTILHVLHLDVLRRQIEIETEGKN